MSSWEEEGEEEKEVQSSWLAVTGGYLMMNEWKYEWNSCKMNEDMSCSYKDDDY